MNNTPNRNIRVFSYAHHTNKIVSVVKISSNTDFALNTSETLDFAKQLLLSACFYNTTDVNKLLQQPSIQNENVTIHSLFQTLRNSLKEDIRIDQVTVVC